MGGKRKIQRHYHGREEENYVRLTWMVKGEFSEINMEDERRIQILIWTVKVEFRQINMDDKMKSRY